LSKQVVGDLQGIQERLLSFSEVYDPFLDRDVSRWTNPGELIALLTDVQLGLARYFEARHPFWRHYRALVDQQVESARWEMAGRGGSLPPFDVALVRALGRKLSLLRWPAWAVPWLAGKAAQAARLDRVFDRFFRVLQRAEADLTADPASCLPLWRYSVPPGFRDRSWDFARFHEGERFVYEPYPMEKYRELMDQLARWGLDDVMHEKTFERLVLAPV
jgi:hypothetical protein